MKQKQYCNKFNKDFKNGPHKKKNLEYSIKKQLNHMIPEKKYFSIPTQEGYH